jgi:hypothetical protein
VSACFVSTGAMMVMMMIIIIIIKINFKLIKIMILLLLLLLWSTPHLPSFLKKKEVAFWSLW